MCGMDKSVGKPQVINSSVSTSTLTHDGHVTANPNNPAEFVNHGKFDSPLCIHVFSCLKTYLGVLWKIYLLVYTNVKCIYVSN